MIKSFAQHAAEFGGRRQTRANFFRAVVRQSFQAFGARERFNFVEVAAGENQSAQIFIDAQNFVESEPPAVTRASTL